MTYYSSKNANKGDLVKDYITLIKNWAAGSAKPEEVITAQAKIESRDLRNYGGVKAVILATIFGEWRIAQKPMDKDIALLALLRVIAAFDTRPSGENIIDFKAKAARNDD